MTAPVKVVKEKKGSSRKCKIRGEIVQATSAVGAPAAGGGGGYLSEDKNACGGGGGGGGGGGRMHKGVVNLAPSATIYVVSAANDTLVAAEKESGKVHP